MKPYGESTIEHPIDRHRPTKDDIDSLEKVAWDARVEHVLIWYRDTIEQLRQRVRESERATKLEHERAIRAEVQVAAGIMGSRTSKRKSESSRKNGKKGGRPRKMAEEPNYCTNPELHAEVGHVSACFTKPDRG